MFLGKRAVFRHFDLPGVKSSDRSDVSWFGLRTIALLGVVAATAATLVGCTQSPVRTSRSYQAAPSQQAWLPTDTDKTFVRSLMQPVHERGKIAAWVAPPRNGINGQPFDYDYVHLA